MIRYICKILTDSRTIDSKFNHVRYLQTLSSVESISSPTDEQMLTISYLTNSCGLSLENAVSASKLVKIESRERPDSVIELFTNHGFTKKDIAKLVVRDPKLILMNPEKILKPKIEYFESVGIVGPLLVRILCSNKQILVTSLKNQIIPTFEFLKSYLETNENIIFALKQSSRVIRCNIQKLLLPNIATLQAHGVPQDRIGTLIRLQPQSLMLRLDLFEKAVNEIEEMGIDPTTNKFILALRSMAMIQPVKWEKKKDLFLRFGWTEEDIKFAFRLQPHIMLCSLEKMSALMDFFVQKMGLDPLSLVRCPNLFMTGLNSRIIPRWSVLQGLMSKGLIEKDIDVVWVMNASKARFEKRFVNRFEDVPEVKAYRDEMVLQASKE